MALLFDDQELRDRRMQTLLQTATQLQQLQQQKQIADQEQTYKNAVLQQTVLKNKADAQTDFAKLGYGPASPQSLNELNMAANPNKGKPLTDVYGQSYTPNPQLLKARQSSGIQRYTIDESGNMVPVPGILVETPQQKMDRKVAGATEQQKNDLAANEVAAITFNQLKSLNEGLQKSGGYAGLAIKGGNVITRGATNPQAKAYAGFMPTAAVQIYRGVTGDSRLSDADAQARALPLIWDIGEDGSVKGIKEGVIDNLLKARNILMTNNVYATKKGDKITDLNDVIFVSNAVNHGVPEDKIIEFLKSKRKK